MKLDFAQRHDHVTPMLVGMHRHAVLELVYYRKGKGKTRIYGRDYAFRPGFFAVIPSGEDHDQTDNGPVESLCFGLIGSRLEELAGGYQDQDGGLLHVCESVLQELATQRPEWPEVVQGLLLQIAGLIRRTARDDAAGGKAGDPRKRRLVAQAVAIIRSRQGMVTVCELSRELYVSHDYLRHLFSEQTGQSPLRAIIQTRLDRAHELLTVTDLPIAEVAARSGFDNPYYFSRLFRQVFRQTPSACRQQAR